MSYTGFSNQTNAELNALEAKHDEEVATLQTNIDTAVSEASAGRALIQSNLDAEVVRATLAEGQLDNKIDQEIADRETAVSAERTRAEGVEASLRADLDQEIADRQTAVSAEETRATEAESALDVRMTAMEDWKTANTDELSNYVNGEVDKAINSKVDSSFFASVQASLEDADSALSQRISSHIVDRQANDEEHRTRLAQSSSNDMNVKAVLEALSAYLNAFSQTYTITDSQGQVVSPPSWVALDGMIASVSAHEATNQDAPSQ